MQFWREYRTQYHLAMEWQVAENTVRRTIERVENTLQEREVYPACPSVEQEWSVVISPNGPWKDPKKHTRAKRKR